MEERSIRTNNKKPLIFIVMIVSFLQSIYAQTWTALGDGLNGDAKVFTIYKDELYVGGLFTQAGSVNANHIAKWNGLNWSTLGSGIDGPVEALFVYNNELYVGGNFTHVDSVVRINIAKWNGTKWSSVPLDLDGVVASFAEYNGKLIIGGSFWHLGPSTNVGHIIKWDGLNASNLEGGVNAVVTSLHVFNGELYVGGAFTSQGVGNPISPYIAKWNDTTWLNVAGGCDQSVNTLTVYNSDLYLGGLFNDVSIDPGTMSVHYIAKWSGSHWGQLINSGGGYGVNSTVLALQVYNEELYVGGQFTNGFGFGIASKYIAKWNGLNWNSVGTGMDNEVYCLAVYNNELYIGGAFIKADSITAKHIAKYSLPTDVKFNSNNEVREYSISQNFPNPFNPDTKISYFVPQAGLVRLTIVDMLGREVSNLVNEYRQVGEYTAQWNASNEPSGVYFYRLVTGGFIQTQKMVLMK